MEQDYFGTHLDHCEQIERAGGADQYHADTKCAEAVAVAVAACAEDTTGQRCYICFEGDAEEGLARRCACRGASGVAHVSCLARQAKILYAEAEQNNLDATVKNARWKRWYSCSLCEQYYHGVVLCALGWACWKTYVGRPEIDRARQLAMNLLGGGLCGAGHQEDAMSVQEAELAMKRRLGSRQYDMLVVQTNLANTYDALGRHEDALRMSRDVYSGTLEMFGNEHRDTLRAATNYAASLNELKRFEEAKSLLRKTIPVARRVLGEGNDMTLRMRKNYAYTLCKDPGATLDDLREAVTTLEETARTARRVLGGAHPGVVNIERVLRRSREVLSAREGGDVESTREALEAMTPGDAN